MATNRSGTSFVKTKRMEGFSDHLTFAACEWFLIFLLLLDSLLSYLLKKFASYCKLQLPCLLCSRLDHIWDGEKPEFYHNLFCGNHKSEISSMMFCHIHGKLADGHRMCDDCLLSLTTNAKRNTKTHRLLAGKFGVVMGGSGYQNSSLSRALFTGPKGSRPCSCCGKLWKLEQNGLRSVHLKTPGRAVLKPYVPLPRAPRQSHLNRRDSMKKIREKTSETEGKRSFHPSSHVGYTVLKLTSDTESEFQFSDYDDDDDGSAFHEKIEASNATFTQNVSEMTTEHVKGDLSPTKPKPSSPKHVEEINRPLADQNSSGFDLPELISLDEVSLSRVNQEPERESEECKITCHSENFLPDDLSELMTLEGYHTPAGDSSEKSVDITQADDTGLVSEKNEEVSEKIDRNEDASTEIDSTASETAPQSPTQENLTEVPDSVTEQPPFNEVVEVKEEQESNVSSFVPTNHDHFPEINAETPKSCLESQDGSGMSEIEGESIVDKLKRQIEYDKKCMDDLQKELEEERNASAIAADEAMSMITRLQEEKAALQMEALQYLRMMDEQAEYDNDEFEKVNDLLAEKEKEIQDLEAELEYYRLNSNLTNEPMVHNMHEQSRDSKEESVTPQNICFHNITDTVNNIPNSQLSEESKGSDEVVDGETSVLEFEEEKQYISHCLKCLEKKLHQLSFNKVSSEASNVGLEKLETSKLNQQGDSNSEGPHLDGHDETDLSIPNVRTLNGNLDDKDDSAASNHDDCSPSIENKDSTSAEPQSSRSRRETDLISLENEISDLHDRLEALEFDHDLIEHITNSLQNGNDGKKFIQDIANQLSELRKIGIRSR
ncbi:myosin-binding protein 3-like [Vicia villosa]|uniref:myosin-binding protein 3-like n=1 Tax=Vicia villosa TaxID=3911 RepID=UPI00273A9E9C|nr:myosin-binding protein 3-like [Vicia villosa]